MRRAAFLALSALGVACGPGVRRATSGVDAVAVSSLEQVSGTVVVEHGQDAVEFANVGADRGVVRQVVVEPLDREASLEFTMHGRVVGAGGYGSVRVMAEVDGGPVALLTLNVVEGEGAGVARTVARPPLAQRLVTEYVVGPGARLIVEDIALRGGTAARGDAPLDVDTAEVLADVERELRYFSPEVPAEFDWAAWLAVANHDLRAVTPGDATRAYIDAWVRRAAPHAAFGTDRVAVAAPARPAPDMQGPRVNLGPRTQGPYISYVEGRDEPAPVGVYVTWEVAASRCSTLRATADVERLAPGGTANLYLIANTGGFKAERRVAALAPGKVVADLPVPTTAQGIRVVIGVEGASELVLRGVAAGCDGALRPLALAGGELRGDGASLYERLPEGCPTCVTLRRRRDEDAAARTVVLGPGVLSYPLVVPNASGRVGASVVAGSYDLDDMNVAAAQLLYSELRTFAVTAARRQPAVRAAFRTAATMAGVVDILAVRARLEAMTAALDDGHARVVVPGSDQGTVPIELRRFGSDVAIVAVHPRFKDVIPVGARVTAIDGEPIDGYLSRVGGRASGATEGWKAVVTARRALYGAVGSIAMVTIVDVQGRTRTLGLPRIDKDAGLDEMLPAEPAQGAEVTAGVRYVRIGMIDQVAVDAAVPQLAQARAIIVDLRGYGGPGQLALLSHLIAKPVESPTWSVALVRPEGVARWEDSTWTLYPAAPRVPGAIVVLTDGRCISAVETVLAVLRSAGKVVVVGEPSAGTNGNEVELELPGGLVAKYTGMRVLVHGRDYNETPPSVDVPVSWTLADVRAGRDPILARGIAVAAGLAR